jgi:hypothetical protein
MILIKIYIKTNFGRVWKDDNVDFIEKGKRWVELCLRQTDEFIQVFFQDNWYTLNTSLVLYAY